jgi:hypothetical protein
MYKKTYLFNVLFALFAFFTLSQQAQADENLFGYARGAETLPEGSWEVYGVLTNRTDKE